MRPPRKAWGIAPADGETLTSVAMRRATVADMRAAAKAASTAEDRELVLMRNLCEISEETLDRVDMRDYAKIQDALMGFLGRG